MDQVMAVNDCYLFGGGAKVIMFHRIVSPRVLGGTPDEAAIAAAVPQAAQVIDELSRLLGDQAFMAGDALSLADLQLGPQLSMLAETPEWASLSERHPNLLAWLSRIEARPSFGHTTWDRLAERAEAA
jgi:glutathione S-transferase